MATRLSNATETRVSRRRWKGAEIATVGSSAGSSTGRSGRGASGGRAGAAPCAAADFGVALARVSLGAEAAFACSSRSSAKMNLRHADGSSGASRMRTRA